MNHHKSSIQREKKKRQHQRQNEEIAICGGPNRNPPSGNRSGAEYNQNREAQVGGYTSGGPIHCNAGDHHMLMLGVGYPNYSRLEELIGFGVCCRLFIYLENTKYLTHTEDGRKF